jgi:hypothetical protein
MKNNTDKADLLPFYLRTCAADLPTPDLREYVFAPPRKWRADFAYYGDQAGPYGVAPRLLIEVDGGTFAFRGGRHAKDSDRAKGNAAAALGLLTMHVSPQMLTNDPGAFLADLRAALKQIGRIP